MNGLLQNSGYLRLAATSLVVVLGGEACNSASIPDGNASDAQLPTPYDANPTDSNPYDACICPESLASAFIDQIVYIESHRPLPISAGLHGQCLDKDLVRTGSLLGGSYALAPTPTEANFIVSYLGILLKDIPFIDAPDTNLSWGASIRSFSPNSEDMIIKVACLLDKAADAGESECSRSYRVTHDITYAWLLPGGVVDASAGCENGFLVSGSCTTDLTSDSYTRLIRGGMSPTDHGEWQCSWRSHDEEAEHPVAAHAFCLEEQLPDGCGCCPSITDSIEARQLVQPLTTGTNRLQVSCEPDELLLLGNCTLDGAASTELADVTIFRFGFPPGVDNTWGCSWNNPSSVAASAIATALCIRRH